MEYNETSKRCTKSVPCPKCCPEYNVPFEKQLCTVRDADGNDVEPLRMEWMWECGNCGHTMPCGKRIKYAKPNAKQQAFIDRIRNGLANYDAKQTRLDVTFNEYNGSVAVFWSRGWWDDLHMAIIGRRGAYRWGTDTEAVGDNKRCPGVYRNHEPFEFV